ncbi:MAG: hypothetical protein S4CHLAM45_05340 [Chlamydiales bacterium]|nr:hypothetical protein [Chlamydiales bacterium]MCH9619925.1 hypothetical protein [Chlamydiales bacterium]MCH9622648.1 hypothetical protein [Chlamydiales bacterium]
MSAISGTTNLTYVQLQGGEELDVESEEEDLGYVSGDQNYGRDGYESGEVPE